MTFAGICLITNNVRQLSEFYQKVLRTTSDCDDEIHQEIHTDGAALAILYCESSNGGNPNISMAFTVDDVDNDINDEDIVHLLLEQQVTTNVNMAKGQGNTFGQNAADKVAKFTGSWKFIIIFLSVLFVWMTLNIIMLTRAFDPYPFILLNLVLSSIAAIQAPLIMMSQNRQEDKDRFRAENDYKVNLKTEIIIQDLHSKIDLILENQEKMMNPPKS